MSFTEWTSRPRLARNAAQTAVATIVAITLSSAIAQAADPLPAPQGPVILLVSGNVGVTNVPEGAAFDRQMLADLGLTELATSTPWTDGVQTFGGVLARTVLERVDASGETVMATALNDYTVEVPTSDFLTYDVLLATTMNGAEMQVSDKGPVWIVYPRDQVPELQDRKLHDRWVWQLKSLQVK